MTGKPLEEFVNREPPPNVYVEPTNRVMSLTMDYLPSARWKDLEGAYARLADYKSTRTL